MFSIGTVMCLFLSTVHQRCPVQLAQKMTPFSTRFLKTVFSNMSESSTCTLYLLILVGSNRSEDSLREAENLKDAPADTEEVICLHNVEARLVTVHGVEDYLAQRQTKEKVSTCNHCQHTVQSLLWRLPGHPFQTRNACLGLVSPPCLSRTAHTEASPCR